MFGIPKAVIGAAICLAVAGMLGNTVVPWLVGVLLLFSVIRRMSGKDPGYAGFAVFALLIVDLCVSGFMPAAFLTAACGFIIWWTDHNWPFRPDLQPAV